MSTFIFCLIFIQVSIFLIAGVVLAFTFYMGVARHDNDELAESEVAPEPPSQQPEQGFAMGDVILTRSELNYLLGI